MTWTAIIPSPTLTSTIVVTSTSSAVPVISDTATAALTSTQTTFQTPVLTSTFTRVPSRTFTKTATPSQTNTAVNTLSPSVTQTKTFTQLPTATSTATRASAATATATATATVAWGNKFELTNILLYPNPYVYSAADLKIKIDISQPAKQVRARIYTASFRRIIEFDSGPSGNKETLVTIPVVQLKKFAAGTYYVVITVVSTTGGKAVSKSAVLVVLK
jgi:hypothetical protein